MADKQLKRCFANLGKKSILANLVVKLCSRYRPETQFVKNMAIDEIEQVIIKNITNKILW